MKPRMKIYAFVESDHSVMWVASRAKAPAIAVGALSGWRYVQEAVISNELDEFIQTGKAHALVDLWI